MHRRANLTSVVVALRQAVLAMTFNALMHTAAAFFQVSIFGHIVVTSMRHVVVVTNPLLLLVPSIVTM